MRFPNPNIPDIRERIAADTAQKLPIRFGETIQLYQAKKDLSASDLMFTPLTAAAWCRYLMGLNDEGEKMEWSPDPLLEDLQKDMELIEFGKLESAQGRLENILSNTGILGVNLYEAGLGEKTELFFSRFIEGPGAVRKTLSKELMNES
ncbi:hypothetical protein [Peribacillus kribbensis]|uniref:mannitol dehydrogenase family protein n=1 Tax=Peribacillus kribbensis TaxID=356658 RepID=UPI00040241F5|nr:hypothetical protein [Peribacillus kribbensis]